MNSKRITHTQFKKKIRSKNSNGLANTGRQNSTTKQLNQKQISILHLRFHHLTVV